MKVPEAPRSVLEIIDWVMMLVKYLKYQKVSTLNLVVSDPPTQGEVQLIADKIDEIIGKVHS